MSVTCEPCNEEDQSLPKWKCVLCRCKECPRYEIPDKEQNLGGNAPETLFLVYKSVYKCLLHMFHGLRENECSKCDAIKTRGYNYKFMTSIRLHWKRQIIIVAALSQIDFHTFI